MTPGLAPSPHEAEDPTLAEDVQQLMRDARALAEAEFAFQKTRAAYAGAEAKGIALLGVVAVVLVFFAVMALVVGAVIALGPVLTAWGAMAAVTLALLTIAGICALAAKARLKRLKNAISDKKG
ncbi:phage holin family protein [Novosphingobium endophyticum]|nr:phage holin family protein [Novosphingobium endophyticum]